MSTTNKITWPFVKSRLKDIWRVIFPLFYAIAIAFVGFWAFWRNDQGRDFFIGMLEHDFTVSYVISSVIGLTVWCLSLWYTARIVSRIKGIDYIDPEFAAKIIKWLPRGLGIFPIILYGGALISVFLDNQQLQRIGIVLPLGTLIGLGLLLFSFFVQRRWIAEKLNVPLEPDKVRFKPGPTDVKDILANKVTRNVIYAILILALLFLLLFLMPIEAGFARWLKPATVVLSGFAFITICLASFIALTNFRMSPWGAVAVLFMILFSRWNDNSKLRRVMDEAPVRQTIEQNLLGWLRARSLLNNDSIKHQKDTVFPIILIAAEGGGIRALNWTALILQRAGTIYPDFMNHVYAISGVSGGGVGSVFYNTYLRDSLSGEPTFKSPFAGSENFKNAISADFLSDVTGALLFPESVQRLLFFPVEYFNRDRKLEDSWSYAYKKNLKLESMEEPFLQIWLKDTSYRYRIPNLLINGVMAESGQKTITSNLDIRQDTSHAFDDDIDVIHTLGYDIPIKTAASLCSRFPLITSGGLLCRNGEDPMGHIIDGGYKENTGIETLWQFMIALRPHLRDIQSANPNLHLPVYLLFIQNSQDPNRGEADSLKPQKTLPDLLTVPLGFIKAWDRRTPTFKAISEKVLNQSELTRVYKYFHIGIKKDSVHLPLGWYLSEMARNDILAQAEQLNPTDSIFLKLRNP